MTLKPVDVIRSEARALPSATMRARLFLKSIESILKPKSCEPVTTSGAPPAHRALPNAGNEHARVLAVAKGPWTGTAFCALAGTERVNRISTSCLARIDGLRWGVSTIVARKATGALGRQSHRCRPFVFALVPAEEPSDAVARPGKDVVERRNHEQRQQRRRDDAADDRAAER